MFSFNILSISLHSLLACVAPEEEFDVIFQSGKSLAVAQAGSELLGSNVPSVCPVQIAELHEYNRPRLDVIHSPAF